MTTRRKTFARNLKYLRKQKKLTQAQVAKVLCVCREAYTQYEQGTRPFPGEMLPEVSELFEYHDIYALFTIPIQAA